MGKGVDSADGVHAQKMGLQLEPEYQHVDLEFALDCKKAKEDQNLELWLLQVPVDFPLEEKTTWETKEDSGGAPVLTCQADGLEYRMEEDNSLGTSSVYAIDGSDSNAATQVDRRLTVYRTTVAPKLCFGLDASEIAPIVEEQEPVRAPKASRLRKASATEAAVAAPASAEGVKDSKKKKKDKKKGGDREDKEEKKKKKKKDK